MRTTMMAVACAVLIGLAGCASNSESTGTPEPSATGAPGVMRALDVVEAEFAAENAGDPDAILVMWSKDSPVYRMTVPEWVGDFDGDGATTAMDGHVSQAALNPAMGKTVDVSCTETSDTVVECTNTISTTFSDLAGVEPAQLQLRFTVKDGLILDQEVLGPVDDAAMQAFAEANMNGIEEYRQWVSTNHADQYPDLFDSAASEMVITRENLAAHEQMLDEFLQSVGSWQ